MVGPIYLKLVAIFIVVAIGWGAGRTRFLGGGEAARALSNAAFYLFAPALLFRTTARIDFEQLPWSIVLAYFIPVVGLMLLVYAQQRRRAAAAPAAPAAPSVRAITATFSNTVQLGIPVAAALFGEAGLSVHLAVVSLHALTLLSVVTVLAELDLSRAAEGHARRSLGATLATTARNTLIHPVVMPVLLGLLWNLLDGPIPPAVDEILVTLGQAVVPVCLIATGMSLAHYGLRGSLGAASVLSLLKLVVQPALVLAVGLAFGLRGLPLAAIVMCAALPAGTNSMMFAQRYATREAEVTSTLVLSMLAFVVTAPLWLLLLQLLPAGWVASGG
ncbi:AEC family transporter [Caldimonas thermodepolymerans]|jgi:Predicted permeases|uniref:AEC family transporter n=1 Tax=Caldimonas thermodepolymerans TaxID=215580 RepID=UPI00249383AA|nr:AEC family transporter [Caldimonas thermodepolymerans]